LKPGRESLGWFDFPTNYSEIRALPSTDKAGRSTDATLVIRDELAYHPYAAANFRSIGPTVDSGGQLIDVSTIDKLDEQNHFSERVNKAREGDCQAHFIFLGWRSRPVRIDGIELDDWYETYVKSKYSEFELEQEYPETVEQALSPSKVICRFDKDALNSMMQDVSHPIEARFDGMVRIYKAPVAGRKYCFGIDPSEGGYDYSVGTIIDWQTCEQVAEFRCKLPVDDQARIILDLYNLYFSPFIAPERNADGRRLIDKLLGLGIKNFYHTSKDKPGWWTDSKSRPVMIADLAEMVSKRNLRVYNREAINEFYSFIRTEKHPEGIATKGRHDDYVIAWAITLQLRKHMPTGGVSIKSFKYRETA